MLPVSSFHIEQRIKQRKRGQRDKKPSESLFPFVLFLKQIVFLLELLSFS